MKKILLSLGLVLALTATVPAAIVDYYNGTGGIIPDNSAAGIT